jgi:outer membrane protein assembly factor BamE
MKKLSRLLLTTTLCASIAAGCSFIHKIDVQQGNVVTQDMLAQLETGMDKAKVRFVMGTPLVVDTFHQDRWDYVYSYEKGSGHREQRRITLHFKNDQLVGINGNIKPASGELAREEHREITVAVPGEVKPGLMSWLKSSIGLEDRVETTNEDRAGEQKKKQATEETLAQSTTPTPDASEAAEEKEGGTQEGQSFFSQVMGELERGDKKTGPGQARSGSETVDSMEGLPPSDPPE